MAGLVALASALALSAPSRAADAAAAERVCRVTVYANDPDPAGTHLRAGPGTAYRIVASSRDGDARYDIIGAVGPWLHVARVLAVDGGARFSGDAWVFGPLTAVRANRRLALRALPDAASAVAGTMAADASGAVAGCDGAWLRVRFGSIDGWMAPGQHCGNPVSACV